MQGFYNSGTGLQVDTNVTVEFRTGFTPDTADTIVATYMMALDSLGLSGTIALESLPEGFYYLVIRHYNHLAVITDSPYEFQEGQSVVLDFSDVGSLDYAEVYGNSPMFSESDGKLSLYGGNGDGNCYVNVMDAYLWIQFNGYQCGQNDYEAASDFDGNCFINVMDAFMWTKSNGNMCYVP